MFLFRSSYRWKTQTEYESRITEKHIARLKAQIVPCMHRPARAIKERAVFDSSFAVAAANASGVQ